MKEPKTVLNGKKPMVHGNLNAGKVAEPKKVTRKTMKMDQSTSGASKTILVLTGKETLKLRWLVV